jgi:hypothetical protein
VRSAVGRPSRGGKGLALEHRTGNQLSIRRGCSFAVPEGQRPRPHLPLPSSSSLFTQIVEEGYEFFGKRQLVTIFSAPNYCGMFENWGAVLNVDQDLICSFHVIKPEGKRGREGNEAKKRPKTPKYVN